MIIELLYFPGCPNHEFAKDILNEVMAEEGISGKIALIEVRTDEEAQRLRFPGSPTIRINGNDIEDIEKIRPHYGVKCRIYETPGGISGFPSKEIVRNAIKRYKDQPLISG